MEFREYLLRQLAAHPSAQPQDVGKLCYQAARGPEHLLADMDGAKAYFQQEWDATEAAAVPLYEELSDGFCRVNLAAWKAENLPGEWLFRMFALSAAATGGEDRLPAYLAAAEAAVEGGETHISPVDFEKYLAEYRAAGMPAVHHSPAYRAAEKPAYRIVCRRIIRLLPVLKLAAACESRPCVIALDGPAASGKTTMAEQLQAILGADVIHMDDFFLPLPLRTPERLAEAGGNVHYERFREEVLPCLRQPEGFSYTRFDCSVMDYNGERTVGGAPYRIVEGSYSHHPVFGDYADVTVFSHISTEEQMARILRRNGPVMAQRFRDVWVPMEEAYFAAHGIRDQADVCV